MRRPLVGAADHAVRSRVTVSVLGAITGGGVGVGSGGGDGVPFASAREYRVHRHWHPVMTAPATSPWTLEVVRSKKH